MAPRTSLPPYSGRCVCEATRFRISSEPLTLYACHCTDCQKRTGSAFALSLWVPRAAVEATMGEPVVRDLAGPGEKRRPGWHCAHCGARLWGEPEKRPTMAVVRAGMLDDTSWLQPVAHLWTRSAQPWFTFPEGVTKYATQPAHFSELLRLWSERGVTGVQQIKDLQ